MENNPRARTAIDHGEVPQWDRRELITVGIPLEESQKAQRQGATAKSWAGGGVITEATLPLYAGASS